MFLSAFLCSKINLWEKGRFFDKNHGLTPLQNFDFFDFFRTSLLRSKNHSFLSRISKHVSFCLSLLKNKPMRKRSIFWQKPWTNSLSKLRFFPLFRTSLFKSKNHSFLSRISKNVSFFLSLLKKNLWEKGRFFDKNHGLTACQN